MSEGTRFLKRMAGVAAAGTPALTHDEVATVVEGLRELEQADQLADRLGVPTSRLHEIIVDIAGRLGMFGCTLNEAVAPEPAAFAAAGYQRRGRNPVADSARKVVGYEPDGHLIARVAYRSDPRLLTHPVYADLQLVRWYAREGLLAELPAGSAVDAQVLQAAYQLLQDEVGKVNAEVAYLAALPALLDGDSPPERNMGAGFRRRFAQQQAAHPDPATLLFKAASRFQQRCEWVYGPRRMEQHLTEPLIGEKARLEMGKAIVWRVARQTDRWRVAGVASLNVASVRRLALSLGMAVEPPPRREARDRLTKLGLLKDAEPLQAEVARAAGAADAAVVSARLWEALQARQDGNRHWDKALRR